MGGKFPELAISWDLFFDSPCFAEGRMHFFCVFSCNYLSVGRQGTLVIAERRYRLTSVCLLSSRQGARLERIGVVPL